jgi:branched-subunit amino acid permease
MLGNLLLLAAMIVLACLTTAVVFILDKATPRETHPDTDKIDWPPQ